MLNKDPTKKILSFEVEDTGIGIEAHKLTTLFKAFGKLDDKVGLNKNGVGLGLMISKDIVEATGG
jgi:signal transduction histidine kinase